MDLDLVETSGMTRG